MIIYGLYTDVTIFGLLRFAPEVCGRITVCYLWMLIGLPLAVLRQHTDMVLLWICRHATL
jgi:hypothetical protein